MGGNALNEYALSFLAGRTIEQAVKDAIRQRYRVVMTANVITGNGKHGPRMEDDRNGVVLADMQLYRGVRAGWVEVKSKARANRYYTWNRDEHGIDLEKWNEYWKLQTESNQTVYLLICEAQSGELLMQSLSTLRSQGKQRTSVWGRDNRRTSINFDRAAFSPVGSMEIPADDLRQMTVSINWETFETFVTQPMLIEEEVTHG